MDSQTKKVLILHASAGHGHLKAAESLLGAIEHYYPNAKVELHDALDFFPAFIKKQYVSGYIFMITKIPGLWGLVYFLTDNKYLYPITGLVRRIFNGIFSKKLVAYIFETKPDVVVSTHFMPPEIGAELKKISTLKTRWVTIITDFLVHRFWIFKETDLYLVAAEATKSALIKEGIQPSRIIINGVPVDEKFSVAKSQHAMREKIGLERNTFTILFTSGGMGAGAIEKTVQKICKDKNDRQAIVVCGSNKALKASMEKKCQGWSNVKVLGFIDNMDEMMDACNVIVGKAGGSTVSEALAKKRPMMIFKPVPGQEAFNAQVLSEAGAAYWIKENKDIPQMIESFMHDDTRRSQVQHAIERIAKPDSSRDAARWIMEP